MTNRPPEGDPVEVGYKPVMSLMAAIKESLAKAEDVGVRDPHHDGACFWRWVGDPRAPRLEHRHDGQSQWTAVKRISVTPQRIALLAAELARFQSDGRERSPQ